MSSKATLIALALVICPLVVLCEDKGASVSLRARWKSTAYMLEAAELLAEEDPSLFWKFLEASLSSTAPSDASQCWGHIVNSTAKLLPEGVAMLTPYVLASRQYSPKVEMFRQLVDQLHPEVQACCFVDVGGRVVTHAADLAPAIRDAAAAKGAGSAQLFAFDHVLKPGARTNESVVAVLYGPLGSTCTKPLHKALKKAADKGSIVYTLRPVLPSSSSTADSSTCTAGSGTCGLGSTCTAEEVGPCGRYGADEPLLLPGWGMEAVLKNTEYSAMDEKDRKAEEAKSSKAKGADDSASLETPVKGFMFDVLVNRKPALRQELLTLRDHLLSSDEEEAVKVWDLKDVGLQATQRIQSAADPLALLAELSQNFPSLVSSLSREKVADELRQAVQHNQQYMSPGANFMLVNGLSVDINTFDLFGFYDRLRSELRLTQSLKSLGLPAAETMALLQLRTEDTSDTVSDARLDLGLGKGGSGEAHVIWLNDLERDKMYTGRFSTSISDILNTFPGRLRPLAVNAFNLVICVDPVAPDALMLGELVTSLWEEYYPIRLGLTLKVPAVHDRLAAARRAPYARGVTDPPEWPAMTVSEKFSRAFLALQTAFGAPPAFKFWMLVGQQVQAERSWGNDGDAILRPAYERAWKSAAKQPSGARARNAAKKTPDAAWADLMAGAGHAAEVGMRLSDMAAWQVTKGIASLTTATGWLNGVQVPLLADTQASQQQLMYKVMMEQQRLQEAVYYGRLSDGDNVLDYLLEQHDAMSRWNPAILSDSDTKQTVIELGPVVSRAEWVHVPRFFLPPPDGFAGTGAPQPHAATHVVVADLNSTQGRELLGQALRFLVEEMRGAQASRVMFILNPTGDPQEAREREPTMLETMLHLSLGYTHQFARLPPGAKDAPPFNASAVAAVTRFLHSLLADAPLAERLSGRIKRHDRAEVEVVTGLASKAGLDGEALLFALVGFIDQEGFERGPIRPHPVMQELRAAHITLAREVLGLEPGAAALITNGRLLHVFRPSGGEENTQQSIVAEDLGLLSLLATKYQPGSSMAALLAAAHADGKLSGMPQETDALTAKLDDILAAAASALAASRPAADAAGSTQAASLSKQLNQVMGALRGGTVDIGPPAGTSPSGLHIVCILNPLTRPAQRISQVLLMLRSSPLAPSISLLLNPQRDLSELPLKSYYRYALPSLGGEHGDAPPGPPAAYFSRLPRKRVLTLNVDVPEAWLVEAVQATHDLDNLRLADLPEGEAVAYAELELVALMLTGSCIDVTQGAQRATPPRGLQLRLGTPSQPHMVDTLVMSNLAYFQLKAAPGRWVLSLAPGRTQEIYRLQSSTGISEEDEVEVEAVEAAGGTTTDELSTQVVVSSMAGKHMILRVSKRPGKEREDVLKAAGEAQGSTQEEEEEEAYGSWAGLEDDEYSEDEGDASKAVAGAPVKAGGDVINVFTVASGHMYERLQKIMILSVIKNTKSKVKFWLISNYMSPHHKQVIPAMAQQYGFDYEFVTYKWPHWLHKQTDKQRIIWAYKILFLDVLFPLGVERIIFVDSDQVVRTDLAELYNMDIKGAPYAYTPFCDNNKEMDEFRFWKAGFWASHLQGKPYHISALYLVDLKRFRALAAGDNLRVIYDQLSKDPNSLANLDQDLPNYAQHQIPIFSLPQQWLWCESWCGTATKTKAKTIDLCNNPKTKEPKLSAARRIISEWPALDAEQAEFTEHLEASLAAEEAAPAAGQQVGGSPGEGAAKHDGSEL